MSLETIDFDRLNVRPGDRLLDLGCGEGRHSISAYLLADAEIVGLDLGLNDLKTAKNRLQEFLMPANKGGYCAFIQGTGHQLPFADNAFDHVICSEVLEHIPNYASFLSEIQRVLKPGGLLLFAESTRAFIHSWIIRLLFRHPMDVQKSAEEYREFIEQAGFDCAANATSYPYLWWSRADLGLVEKLLGPRPPATREETLLNLVAVKH